jgi:glycerophosphoryl diester phosphodiesterase
MKAKQIINSLLVCCLLVSCAKSSKPKSVQLKKYTFDLQAHRGGAALYPENSMEAFKNATSLDVNTLELDVVVTKDSMVVVSHEAYMRPGICKTPNGEVVQAKEEYNIFNMTYEEVKAFDCGSLGNPKFPNQKKVSTYKPLLSEVIQFTTQHLREKGTRPSLNIEIKSLPETDSIYHPEPEEFVRLVMTVISKELIPTSKITIQSFDKRVVREVVEKYPMFQTAYLVEDGKVQDNITDLKSVPSIYSPDYKLLDSIQIKQAHDMGMKVIPWTVNEFTEMQRLLEMGVDGIITDYPNLAKAIHN